MERVMIYTDKKWLSAPVFVVDDEADNKMGTLSVIPAFVVDRCQFDKIEQDFETEKVHLGIMLESFHYNSRQGTLEPLNPAAKGEAGQ